MKSILNFFTRKKNQMKRKYEEHYGMSNLNPDLQKNINSWSSSVAKEMETQLFMLIDIRKKLDEMKKSNNN
jgi:hypothetical protein